MTAGGAGWEGNPVQARQEIAQLAKHFWQAGVTGIGLTGSWARGDGGAYSDVDLVRLVEAPTAGAGSHLLEGKLVNVSDLTAADVEQLFTEPEAAVAAMSGLKTLWEIIDPAGAIALLCKRALDFQWDEAMQAKADAWASQQMVGWVEEVLKGLEGLRRRDAGRLLNAEFGCTWGLTRVVCVQRGILLESDNTIFRQVAMAMDMHSRWVNLWRRAFGMDIEPMAPGLAARVTAGLWLYVETAELLQEYLAEEDHPLVMYAVACITRELGEPGDE
jgi:predicted nucleotidyltransferase